MATQHDPAATPAPARTPPRREDGIDTARVIAFSDGVFAIAITLLVLELQIPRVESGLLTALRAEWPAYLSYALSFIVIGIIWAQHHYVYSLVKRTDHVFLLINILFLMWVGFLPFPTGVLGEQIDRSAGATTAMAFYAGTFLVGAVIYQLLWWYARLGYRLLAPDVNPRAVAVVDRSYLAGVPLYALDFALAFVNVTASLVLFVLIAVLYAVAPLFGRPQAELTEP